jgi:multiple sugar transport system permease protein
MNPQSPLRWVAVTAAVIWSLLPIYWLLRMAFMTTAEISLFPPAILPPAPQPGAFFNLLGIPYVTAQGINLLASGQSGQVILGLGNSVVISFVVTVVTLMVVVPLAYVYGRFEFRFKNVLFFSVLLAVAQPPVSTLIPFYALYIRLGLAGTRLGLIIVVLTITIPFVTWMLIGYFRNLPPVERLARVDGFSRGATFLMIIVPMARSGIAVAAAIAFLFSWNEYVYAQVLVGGSTAITLPAAMSGFLFQLPNPPHLAAAMFLTLVPPFFIAFVLQRRLTEMNLVDPVR